jgi:RNA polymerase sigma-70 factor (ECF subfamily)
VHAYGQLIFHLIYGLTHDWQESQDLTQDVFLRALEGIDAARAATGRNFQARAWLLRIAVNVARMHQRRARLYRFLPFSAMEDEQEAEATARSEQVTAKATPCQPPGYAPHEPANPAELVAERDAVARTLARLPESQRLPLLLSTVAGCSHAEIARILDLEEATLRQRLSRGRRAFQTLYAQESGEVVKVATQDRPMPPRGRKAQRLVKAVRTAAG